jgi:hypothetical protein
MSLRLLGVEAVHKGFELEVERASKATLDGGL